MEMFNREASSLGSEGDSLIEVIIFELSYQCLNRTKLGEEEEKNIPGPGSSMYKSPDAKENMTQSRLGREANKVAER